jgi:hypothetical protein
MQIFEASSPENSSPSKRGKRRQLHTLTFLFLHLPHPVLDFRCGFRDDGLIGCPVVIRWTNRRYDLPQADQQLPMSYNNAQAVYM